MTRAIRSSVSVVLVLVLLNIVNSEPPVQNAQQNSGGWGNSQQQASGGYSGGQSNSGGYSNGGGQNGGGGWGQQQQQQQPQQDGRNGGGWGQQQQQQQNSGGDGGGWGQGQQQQQQQNGNGWGMDQNQMQKDQGNNGWGPQLNFEVDTANLKGFNPFKILKSIAGIPRKIINFIRESGLYILFIPLLIILPLLLLAFNFGKLIGGFGGWGWGRSLSTVENGIVGYLKSPAWQKVAETLMDEHVFDRVMKSLEEFRKDWKTSGQVPSIGQSSD